MFVEEVLASIWAQVLGVEQVGIHDNFFALGGHSLSAIKIVSRMNHTFQIDMLLPDFFDSPTVADLARNVESRRRETQGLCVLPLIPVDREGGVPLSHNQKRLWYFNQSNLETAFFNTPAVIRLEGTLEVQAFERAFSEISRRHEILRTVYVVRDRLPVQVVIPPPIFPLPLIDLQELAEGERETAALQIAEQEATRPFDLARHPSMRAALLRLAKSEHVLVMTMHHIAFDGWSFGIFIQELISLYGAFSMQRSTSLPELPIQYADYAYWQQTWLQSGSMKAQVAYWKQQLKGPLRPLPFLPGRNRPRSQVIRYSQQSLMVPKSQHQALLSLGYEENTTAFMTLLAIFKVTLNRFTGEDDIRVGTLVANRNRTEIEPLIGLFLNTLVLRTDLSGDVSFRGVLRRVRQTTWKLTPIRTSRSTI